jgi:mannose/cellobiose epimerase-like protein (N-acyl-D-glucosamine 2-epimerase family)
MTTMTIAIEEEVLERATQRANAEGTSVPHLLEAYLQAYSASQQQPTQRTQRLLELANRIQGDSAGERWTRAELHA